MNQDLDLFRALEVEEIREDRDLNGDLYYYDYSNYARLMDASGWYYYKY